MNKEISEMDKEINEMNKLVNEYYLNQFIKNHNIEVNCEDHLNYVSEELHELLMER